MILQYSRGSKWDLQVHTPSGNDVWDDFCDDIEKSDVKVIGITDYFFFENFFTFTDKFKAKYHRFEENKI